MPTRLTALFGNHVSMLTVPFGIHFNTTTVEPFGIHIIHYKLPFGIHDHTTTVPFGIHVR